MASSRPLLLSLAFAFALSMVSPFAALSHTLDTAPEKGQPVATATKRVPDSFQNTAVVPIPEVDPSIPAIVLCVAAVVFAHVRKRRRT